MRVALFSDVHGNGIAFDAFLADLGRQDVDHIVCLGDHAQGARSLPSVWSGSAISGARP